METKSIAAKKPKERKTYKNMSIFINPLAAKTNYPYWRDKFWTNQALNNN